MNTASAAADSFAMSSPGRPSMFDAEAEAARLGRAATSALHDELALYPKPGLVSFIDNGSHADMTARTFLRSIVSLRDYFRRIAAIGAADAPFAALEQLGIAAERRMSLATGGVNTHRGAIFTIGLLCAAAARPSAERVGALSAALVRARLIERWGAALAARGDDGSESNGQRACRRHALHGARGEAADAFPVLFEIAVPTLTAALRDGLDRRHAQLQTFFAVMASLDDTNLVHRGGIDGLRYARRQASSFLAAGGAHRADAVTHAERIHREFVARRLSPGGSADVLAAACFVARICG
ncbi:MAG TPA: triphosphoribosyl-dephospho-CoA synthase MdcB [Caldimonas sp.]|nr:triphosphoribosyl-dephospho-CoA synthase MdcB [Caldimonas sp.]HEV7574913.1 triphosphoribosyl-dephospho-CoA synthase MdcB [Caldimonas sp.]